MEDYLLSSVDHCAVLLEDFDALTKEGENTHDVVVLPLLDELYLRELEVILFLELCLRGKDSLCLVDFEGFSKCEICLGENMLDEEEIFCGCVDGIRGE